MITDTGIGISPDFLPHIFENFAREKNSSLSGVYGAGLGLPVVKKLLELMGGFTWKAVLEREPELP